MKTEVEKIVRKALNLPYTARAYLAEILLESLDYEEDFPVSDEWKVEIQKRCKEIDNVDVQLIDGESALAELRKNYYEAI